MNSVIRSSVLTLIEALKAKMPSIVKAYDEFPNQSQALKFPSLSVSSRDPDLIACSPYVLNKNLNITDAEGRKQVIKCVGNYELKMQLDIWCESKFQRSKIYDEFFNAFHGVYPTMGFNAKMIEYYDQYMSFAQVNLSLMDDGEMSSQRNEWRIKVDIVGSCRAIVSSMEYLIETIENNTSVDNNLQDQAPAAEVKQII